MKLKKLRLNSILVENNDLKKINTDFIISDYTEPNATELVLLRAAYFEVSIDKV